MIVKYTRKEEETHFSYDVTMFWEFFRWEHHKIGHIYLQRFPNGKLYAGQSIRLFKRMSNYRNGKGANPHHSNAIEKHGWSNVNVLAIKCPWYMLDTIEIFLISFYDLMDSKKGYNKQSGGRKNWHMSKETRAKISAALKGKKRTPEQVAKWTGENHGMYGQKGPDNPNYGKTWTQKPEAVEKKTGENSHMYGKKGPDHPNYGKTWTQKPETVAKRTGEKNGSSRTVCVFEKVYPTAKDASDVLRAEHAPISNYNFIKDWTRSPKHRSYTFYVSKEFYAYAVENELENITRNLYDNWLLFVNSY
jgi:group I intron endonuclease